MIKLPKDKKALARILARHSVRCEQAYAFRRINWLLAWYYLQGYRRFDVYDPSSGALIPHILDKEGTMEFQSQDLLAKINQIAGRLQTMNLGPHVSQSGFSMGGLRNRSVMQILLDSGVPQGEVDKVAEQWAWQFSCLGFAGITGIVEDHPTVGLTTNLKVVHPRELFPFPLVGQDYTSAQGIMRVQWVPLDYLKDVYGARKIASKLDDLEWYEVEPGEMWNERNNQAQSLGTLTYHGHVSQNQGGESNEDDFIGVVKVKELWLDGAAGTVSRYVATSGDAVLDDQDLEGSNVYCPIGYARFMNNGSFYGAGAFDLMFSIHRELEKMTKSLFRNIQDIDKYGVLVLPSGQMNQNSVLRDIGNGLRVMFWDPDTLAEGFNPFNIQPFNTGDMPGRVAQFAREALNAVNPIQDLVQEKGRVDSAAGLQFLDEQMNQALTSPTSGVQRAFGQCYRSVGQRIVRQLALSPRAVPVGELSLDMAGAIIDPRDSSVTFTENANLLPDVSRLNFTVKQTSPKNTVGRKQEAVQLWQLGIVTDPMEFRLLAIKEGLDFPMWMEDYKGAYEMSIRTVLTVFNDGESPGQVILTPHTTRPEVLVRVATALMTGPACQYASPPVVDALRMLRETCLMYMGLVLPAAVPNPDDAAMLSMGPMATMGAQGMGSPMGMLGQGAQAQAPMMN